jgi:hypothetical protein
MMLSDIDGDDVNHPQRTHWYRFDNVIDHLAESAVL